MKRVLLRSAVCLLLLLSCAFLSAAAPAQEELRNTNAVAIMRDIGLFSGYEDGSFRPANNVRRREAAKIMALICEADPKTEARCNFADVPAGDWAERYIAYCSEKGIVVGSNGLFRPNGYVTGREFSKMLLGCLGYDVSGYQGDTWAASVDHAAAELGIYRGFSADPGAYLDRDDACLLVYNALQCFAVMGKAPDGTVLYQMDDLMNPVTYMEYRYGMTRCAGIVTGNEFLDLTHPETPLQRGRTKLAGHTELNVSTPISFLERKAEIYTMEKTIDGQPSRVVVGMPTVDPTEEVVSVNSFDFFAQFLGYGEYVVGPLTEYYVNGSRASADFGAHLGTDHTITGLDRDGDKILDAVLAYDYIPATILGTEPLMAQADGKNVSVRAMETLQPVRGETYRCLHLGGVYWLVD